MEKLAFGWRYQEFWEPSLVDDLDQYRCDHYHGEAEIYEDPESRKQQ